MPQCYKTVLLFGAPGVGKGTQGGILSAIPGFFHFATGDMFRSLNRNSALGKTFYQYSARGELVPDDITIKAWQQSVQEKCDSQVYDVERDLLLLDGVPRTIEQTRLMDGLIDVLGIVHLVCEHPEIMFERLRSRAQKQNRHDDAKERVVRNRWAVYERETAPVLDRYEKSLIHRVDAVGTPAQVLRRMLRIIEPLQNQHFEPFG